jgi:hypothetical protein
MPGATDDGPSLTHDEIYKSLDLKAAPVRADSDSTSSTASSDSSPSAADIKSVNPTLRTKVAAVSI